MEEKKVVEAEVVREEKNGQEKKKDQYQEDKAITYLSYLGPLCLVPLFVKKESAFSQFHAKQGLVLAVGWLLGSWFYPFFLLGFFVHVAVVVFSILGLLAVSDGQMKKFPIVGDLAEKINF